MFSSLPKREPGLRGQIAGTTLCLVLKASPQEMVRHDTGITVRACPARRSLPSLAFTVRPDLEDPPIVIPEELIDRLRVLAGVYKGRLSPQRRPPAVLIAGCSAKAGIVGIAVTGSPNGVTGVIMTEAGKNSIVHSYEDAERYGHHTIDLTARGVYQSGPGNPVRGLELFELVDQIAPLPHDLGAVVIADVDLRSWAGPAAVQDLRRVQQPLQLLPLAATTRRKMVEAVTGSIHLAIRRLN